MIIVLHLVLSILHNSELPLQTDVLRFTHESSVQWKAILLSNTKHWKYKINYNDNDINYNDFTILQDMQIQ